MSDPKYWFAPEQIEMRDKEIARLKSELAEAQSFRANYEHACKIEREDHDAKIDEANKRISSLTRALAEAQQARDRGESDLAMATSALKSAEGERDYFQTERDTANDLRDRYELEYNKTEQARQALVSKCALAELECDTANDLLRRAQGMMQELAAKYSPWFDLYAAISARSPRRANSAERP